MNPTIEQIFATGAVLDAAGTSRPNIVSSMSREGGTLLYDLVRSIRPQRSIETGMAYGLSTLFICQALRDNGAGRHTAIDPFQAKSFDNVGLGSLERAALRDLVRFYEAPSDEVLPALRAAGERFDFAFIDGDHRFDAALVDFFYIDRMLEPGGHLAIDDLAIAPVRKVMSYALRNAAYRLVRPPTAARPPAWRRLLRLARRVLQNPLGPDWALKLVPHNVAVLRKVDGTRRPWRDHRRF
ncbi:MAG: class I SAM-dependent methyltransferase [Myxococcota bacterium]